MNESERKVMVVLVNAILIAGALKEDAKLEDELGGLTYEYIGGLTKISENIVEKTLSNLKEF